MGLAAAYAAYYGMITNIDDNFGRLLARLDEWRLSERTLLIFMTDNGHARGNLYNAGMRSMKGSPFKERYWRQFGGGPDETLLKQMDPMRTI